MSTLRAALAAAAIAFSTLAQAQAWPAKPVKIVVPYPPGGAVDVVTRKMAAKLQEQTGQTFYVENKAGATGTIGIAGVVQSPADGYTLVANDTTYALLPHIFKKLPFDHAGSLEPVAAFVFAPMSSFVVVATGNDPNPASTLTGNIFLYEITDPNSPTFLSGTDSYDDLLPGPLTPR